MSPLSTEDLKRRINSLESQLKEAREELELQQAEAHTISRQSLPKSENSGLVKGEPCLPSSFHSLLLLSDSALPLGSFAYSSGLESFLAHHKSVPPGIPQPALLHRFLYSTIGSTASTTVPYLLAGYRRPETLRQLDNDLDASTPCTVSRRASIAQGKALLTAWEKAFSTSHRHSSSEKLISIAALDSFATSLKLASLSTEIITSNGHFAPLWGVTSCILGIDLRQSAYIFLVSHAKAVLGAAVRASVLGPYQMWNILASKGLQRIICKSLDEVWTMLPEDAAQVMPSMDLWAGRHELLYSRIFNS